MKTAIEILQKAILDRMQENAGPEVNGFKPLIDFNKPVTDPYIIELQNAIRVLENQTPIDLILFDGNHNDPKSD